MESGVYIIKNTVNGKLYVGSTKDFRKRLHAHRYALLRNKHHSKKLQNAWNKYGDKSFVFEKVLVCGVDDLLFYEQRIIDGFDTCKNGYNQLPKAGSREGAPHDAETIKKMKTFQRSFRKKYDWKGQNLCLSEIAELEGISVKVLTRRVLEDGVDLKEAIYRPHTKRGQTINGMGLSLTFYEWVDKIGCTQSFLRLWLGKGLSIEECVAKHKSITRGEFARLSGVDSNVFLQRLRLGWCVGDAIGNAVKSPFSREDAKTIRELAKTIPLVRIAQKYDVHPDTISLIVRNVSFKEIVK